MKMRDIKFNKQLSVDERKELFHDSFDASTDAALTLATLVQKSGDYLARIVGNESADAGMAVMLAPLGNVNAVSWRKNLADRSSDCFSYWPLGTLLHNLAAYAHFGIVLDATEDEPETAVEQRLGQMVAEATTFLADSPIDLWSVGGDAYVLKRLVALAECRWALDRGDPVDPAALAVFGDVTEARIRNMMSGKNSYFTNRDGKIPARQALKWLADRESFFDSIWRKQRIPPELLAGDSLREPLFVPVARDGSFFHPELRHGGSFTVGPKGAEKKIADFREALVELQRMPIPFWRRPNERNAWGIVRGTHWERYELQALLALAGRHGDDDSDAGDTSGD